MRSRDLEQKFSGQARRKKGENKWLGQKPKKMKN